MNISNLFDAGHLVLDIDSVSSMKISKLATLSTEIIEKMTNNDHKLKVEGVKEIFNLQFQQDEKLFFEKYSTLNLQYLELAYDVMKILNPIAIQLAIECEKKLKLITKELSDSLVSPSSTLRPTYYYPGKSSLGDKHFDTSIFTLVCGETSSGLRVFNKDQEIKVKYNQNQIVVLLGEIFEFFMESKMKATIHQVIREAEQVEKSRTSIAYFIHGNLQNNFKSIPTGKYNFKTYQDLINFIAKRNMAFFK